MIYTTLIPLKGKATKADAKILKAETNGAEICFNEEDASKANSRILAIREKLSRRYIVVMYTEQQYHNRKLQKLINILTPDQIAKIQII